MQFKQCGYVRFATWMILSSILLVGCKEEGTYNGPYREMDLYHLTFDELDGNWERYPRVSGHIKDSCVFTENGVLKMMLRPGYHGCGGCLAIGRLHLELEDPAAKHPELLDRFGMVLTIDRGSFQTIEYRYDTLDQAGKPASYMQYIKRRRLFLNYNKFSIVLPTAVFGQYYNDSDFDLNDNILDAHQYHLVYDRGETHIYLDGVEQDVPNIQIGTSSPNNWAFRLQLDLDRHPMFNDQLEELHIDDLRLYTWQGEREYGK